MGSLKCKLTIGNPGSLCVTRDITQVNYREHMRRKFRSENLLENGNKNRCLPLYYEGQVMKTTFPKKLRVRIKDNKNSPHGKFHRF